MTGRVWGAAILMVLLCWIVLVAMWRLRQAEETGRAA